MMNIKAIAVLLCLSFVWFAFAKPKYKRIIINEYEGAIIFPKKQHGEHFTKEVENGYIKVELHNYRGAMHLRFYSKDSLLREEGNYINSLALLRKYSYMVSANGGGFVKVVEYYQPLRHGKWKFYDSTGTVSDSLFYDKGFEK